MPEKIRGSKTWLALKKRWINPRSLVLLFALVVALSLLVAASQEGRGLETLTLATTTSTYDSGLLNELLPPFEEANHVKVKIVAVGTGQALALGKRGDVDVVLVHDPAKEEEFVAQGYGVNRKDVMYNDFVIVGPISDPAGVSQATSAANAFAAIAAAQATFVSRGDESGTHIREKTIWASLSLTPGGDWYVSTGQGMAAVLTMANEMRGCYTLTDRGTYLAHREGLDLVILFENDSTLYNPYGVIAVNPQRHPQVNYEMAMKFVAYITSVQAQEAIADFGKEQYGEPLFFPNSEQWRAERG